MQNLDSKLIFLNEKKFVKLSQVGTRYIGSGLIGKGGPGFESWWSVALNSSQFPYRFRQLLDDTTR